MIDTINSDERIIRQLRAADDALYGAILTFQNFDQKYCDKILSDFTSNNPLGSSNIKNLKDSKLIDASNEAYLTLSHTLLVALSIEIYLKLLLLIQNIELSKQHSLNNLFNELYEHDPDLIKKIFKTTNYTPETRLEELASHKNIFVDFRYFYEKENVVASSKFLFDTAINLHIYFRNVYNNQRTNFSN